jgi:hypothetical protein
MSLAGIRLLKWVRARVPKLPVAPVISFFIIYLHVIAVNRLIGTDSALNLAYDQFDEMNGNHA